MFGSQREEGAVGIIQIAPWADARDHDPMGPFGAASDRWQHDGGRARFGMRSAGQGSVEPRIEVGDTSSTRDMKAG